jgi:hypothetical protein
MLSLNVASERAELAKLERQIVTAKREIRSLQTELGTRGRLQQLESWNANVLALSAPTSAQFLENELTLARFERQEETIDERAKVQMANAPAVEAPKVQQKIEAPVHYVAAPAAAKPAPSLVHRASLVAEAKPAPAAKPVTAEKKAALAPAKTEEKKPAVVKIAALEVDVPARSEKKPETSKKAEPKKATPAKLARESSAKADRSEDSVGR